MGNWEGISLQANPRVLSTHEVGVVGGIVGVLGGLGGFISPIIFGWLLELTGLWSSAWMFVLRRHTICFCTSNKCN